MHFDDEPEDDLDTGIDDAGGEVPEIETGELEGEEIILELDDDELAERDDDTPTVKKLRAKLRDEQRDKLAIKRDLEAQRRSSAPPPIEVGPEPVWDDNEDKWDYSGSKFAAAHREWEKRRDEAASAATRQSDAQRAQNQEFERVKQQHMQRAAKLSIPAEQFSKLESNVTEAIGPEILGAALILAKDSARLVAAIGNKPDLLTKLADEPNPLVKLKMLRDWEDKIVTKRNAPPPPESLTIERGSASLAKPNHEKELARLEAEADRTGKRDKVIAFKRKMNERSKAA